MTWFEKLDEVIEKYLPDLPMEQDVPMSRLTSFHIGGPARRVAYPKNREQLVILLGLADECGARPLLWETGPIFWLRTRAWSVWWCARPGR